MKTIIVNQSDLCPFHKEILEENEWKDICTILFNEKNISSFYCINSWDEDQTKFSSNCPLLKENITVVKD